MKAVIIANYKQGLASFLDSKNIKCSSLPNEVIKIYVESDAQLFEIAFEFGCFYSNEKNY